MTRCDAIAVTENATGQETSMEKQNCFVKIQEISHWLQLLELHQKMQKQLELGDMAIIGSYFKDNYKDFGDVSVEHVKTFMDEIKNQGGIIMIKLVRVDHRLIHGQVAFTWTKFLSTDCILIASDELLKDELRMAGLKMAKPSNVKLVMKSIADSIKALNSGVTDKYNLLILCESVEDVYRLAKEVKAIKSINLGGTKSDDNH